MKIVIAIDSFKGSLSSYEAGTEAAESARKVFPEAEVLVVPVADGGEGTVCTLAESMNGTTVKCTVKDPLGKAVDCVYGITAKGTAVIEMAECSGLVLVPKEQRDPLKTGTQGLGELIIDALDKGCREFIVGIGGSATNDLGTGMLHSLGVRFTDEMGEEVYPCGGELGRIKRVDISAMDKRLAQCSFKVACDVDNTLLGERGCANVFAPQKGASPETVKILEANGKSFADVTAKTLGIDMRDFPGAGAAGGLGFAFISFLPAELRPGIEIISEEIALMKKLENADIVITGEGKIDSQTAMGKTPVGVARLAKKAGATVICLCGSVEPTASVCHEKGIDAFFSISQGPCSLEQALDKENAKRNLRTETEQVLRLIKAAKIC